MPILKAPCLISYPRTKFSSSFPQNSLLKMANRRQVRNHLQIGGNILHYHVQYCPFQPSEVPGTLVAWLTGQDLAIGDVRVGPPCSCDDQEGMRLAGLARQGLFRDRKDLRSPRLLQGSTCSKTSLARLDFSENDCAMLRIAQLVHN
jgi:hypothetical protein